MDEELEPEVKKIWRVETKTHQPDDMELQYLTLLFNAND
jgi:hypothetical protein